MRASRLIALFVFCPTLLLGQARPTPPRPVPTLPHAPPMPGGQGQQVPLPDPCRDLMSQPHVTFTLSPAEIYGEDRITVSWEVRDRNPQLQWGHPVHVETSDARPSFPDPAGRRGSHTFSTPAARGRVTLRTWCAEKHLDWQRIPDATLDSVDPERGAVGSTVRLRGTNFGQQRGAGRAELVSADRVREMAVASWGNTRIDATVPNGAPSGQATIRVVKGGRRETAGQAFRVVRSIAVNTAMARLAADAAGLSAAEILVTHGDNASHVNLGGDLPDLPFTVPAAKFKVPEEATITAVALAPGMPIPLEVKFSVNDIRSRAPEISVSNGQLVLSMGFEEEGREIIGEARVCVSAVVGCLDRYWADDACPDVEISGARVTLRLTPGVADGRLTFPSATDSFEANIRVRGFSGWLEPLVSNWTADAERRIGREVHAALNTARVRDAVAAGVMAALQQAGEQRIVSVTPAGNQIVVEYE
ncbi:MAG: hypothetical protein ACOY3Y_12680 [Acidobacteriota bacterium]